MASEAPPNKEEVNNMPKKVEVDGVTYFCKAKHPITEKKILLKCKPHQCGDLGKIKEKKEKKNEEAREMPALRK